MGWQTAALKAHRKPLLWPGPGVPVGEVALALALGCLKGKWPWPWGACWGSCLRVKVWRAWKRTRSTPAVVPGAAPALAKAGVGGFIIDYH